MRVEFCVDALEAALAREGAPEVFSSDQGAPSTGTDVTGVLRGAKVQGSLEGRGCRNPSHRLQANDGRAADNRMIGRLWRSLKHECDGLIACETGSRTRDGIGAWVRHDTEKRPSAPRRLSVPDKA